MTIQQRNLHLHITTRVKSGGNTLLIERLEPVNAWHAGLTPEEQRRESVVSRRRFEQLRSLIESHKKWNAWRKRGRAEFTWMLGRAHKEGHQWLALLLYQATDEEVRRRAAWQFNAILDATFERGYPLFKEGRLTPVRPMCSFIGPRAKRLRSFARAVLEKVGAPLDEWHLASALSILLCPQLAPILVSPGFWLERRADGQSDLERQHAAFVGAPNSTERAGVKAKQDLRRHLGFQPPRPAPGPTRGAKYAPSPARVAFTDYVVARQQRGLIAKQIAADGEAQRLYRELHTDSARELSVSAVRYALRRSNGRGGRRLHQI